MPPLRSYFRFRLPFQAHTPAPLNEGSDITEPLLSNSTAVPDDHELLARPLTAVTPLPKQPLLVLFIMRLSEPISYHVVSILQLKGLLAASMY